MKAAIQVAILCGFIAALSATAAVQADKIYLKDGRVVEGEIVKEDDRGVTLRKKLGAITYKHSEILRIEKGGGAKLEEEYKARLEKTDRKDVEALADLARWCVESKLGEEARDHWDEIIVLDPDNEEAHKARGHVKSRDGEWLTGAEARRRKREEKETAKVTKREEGKAEEYEGVPWGEAKPYPSEHYVVTCNAGEAVAKRYSNLLESAYEAFYEFFKKIHTPGKETSEVFILSNYDEFQSLVQRPGILGYYMPMARSGVPARTVVAFHGGFGATGNTDGVLLHEATHQFEDLVVDNLWNAPVWLIEGLAVFFEASRIEKGKVIYKEPGSRKVGIVPAERLVPLQNGIKAGKGRYIPLKMLINTPQPRFGGYHYAHGWSLVYWMWNADGGTHRSMFDSLWKIARERAVTSAEFEQMIKDDTGHDIEQFEEKVWKPYVLGIETPPTGVIKKSKFTSALMKMEVSKPRRGWTWEMEDLPVHLQARIKNSKREATIEVGSVMNRIPMEDLLEKGLEGVFDDAVAEARTAVENIVLDPWAEEEEGGIKEERLSLGGYKAVRFEYEVPANGPEEEPADEEDEDEDGEEEGEEEDDEETTTNFLVLIPTVERMYRITCECPTPQADKVRPDFDKVVKSFKILP